MTTPALPIRKIRRWNIKGNDGKAVRRRSVYNICTAFCICVSFILFIRIPRLGPSSTNDSATSLNSLDIGSTQHTGTTATTATTAASQPVPPLVPPQHLIEDDKTEVVSRPSSPTNPPRNSKIQPLSSSTPNKSSASSSTSLPIATSSPTSSPTNSSTSRPTTPPSNSKHQTNHKKITEVMELNGSLQNNTDRSDHSWRPSHEWLTDCVSNVSKTNSEVIPFNASIKWQGYTLGDCIKLCRNCDNELQLNDTFAQVYKARNCNGDHKSGNITGNITFVREMLDTYNGKQPFPKPAEDELVLHFRLGDIIERANASVTTMLSEGANPAHPAIKFKSSIRSADEYLNNIAESGLSKVAIRGGSHRHFEYKKSRVYAGCIKRAIETAGYEVKMELDSGSPDADFYYMAFGKKIVVSTGGYSRYIGKLVQLGGGEIIGRQF